MREAHLIINFKIRILYVISKMQINKKSSPKASMPKVHEIDNNVLNEKRAWETSHHQSTSETR